MTEPFPPHRIEPFLDEAAILKRVDELADEIVDAVDGELHVVALLAGAIMFTADLVRALSRRGMNVRMSFIRASSYGAGTQSSGQVGLGPLPRLVGDDVLLVDDILDTGRTLGRVGAAIESLGAKSVRTVVLLDKPSRRVVKLGADHVGFSIPDAFVIGYGLDWAGRFRNLRDVRIVRFPDAADSDAAIEAPEI